MDDLIISFLGPSKYLEAYYEFNGIKTRKSYSFIQEAILELFNDKLSEPSKFIIVLTELSRIKNWYSKSESELALNEFGLKDLLINLKSDLKIDIIIEDLLIPEGKSEKELWEIFDKITKAIPENSNVILDITHSYRSLPLLSIIILNYVRFLKRVNINRIIYGALEAKGSVKDVEKLPINERVIPIFNLTPFSSLFDWTIAIERFLETGDAKVIQELGKSELISNLKESKGKIGKNLIKLINMLSSFSNKVSMCRGPEIRKNIKGIANTMKEARKEISLIKPFSPLFNKVESQFNDFNIEDDILQMIEISRWCFEKGLIQQSLTFLRETIINYVIKNYLKTNSNNYQLLYVQEDVREKATNLLNEKATDLPKKLIDLWTSLIQFRNDINHAGWRKCMNPVRTIKQKCEFFINQLKDFF